MASSGCSTPAWRSLTPLCLAGGLLAACGADASPSSAGPAPHASGGAAGAPQAPWGGAGGSPIAGTAGVGGATAGSPGVAGRSSSGTGGEAAAFDGPTLLSETGLYANLATRELAPGVMPYAVNHELWSDGALKRRYVYIPPGTSIDTSSPDRWRWPVGSRAWKQFERDGRLVETRLVEKLDDRGEGTSWRAVAYLWREDGSDADAVPAGVTDARQTPHDVPDLEACRDCHAGTRDYFLGLSAVQLHGASGLLDQLAATGQLSDSVVEPALQAAPSVAAALGYLHANCGHCHSNRGRLADVIPLRLELHATDALAEQTDAYVSTLGVRARHVVEGTSVVVVPGAPEQSQLYVRSALRDLGSMPPLGTEVVDAEGLDLLRVWIAGLDAP